MAKHILKILQYEHRKIFKVYLAILLHLYIKGLKTRKDKIEFNYDQPRQTS